MQAKDCVPAVCLCCLGPWFVPHRPISDLCMGFLGCAPGADLQSDDIHLGYSDGLLLSAGLPVQPTGWQHVILRQRGKCEF